jgi:tetratricopeptide (TPR) repeat protein
MTDPLDQAQADINRLDYSGAHQRCTALLQQQPNNPRALFLLARILAENEKLGDAFRLFDRAAELGHPESETLAQQALCLMRNAQPDEALLFAGRARDLDPADAHALHAIGIVYSRTERHADATAFYDQAIAADPTVANFHYSLAVNQQAIGNTNAARKAYRDCLDIEPDNFRALGAWVHITPMTPDDIARMEAQVPTAEAVANPMARLRLGHALAKACDDTDQPAEAMRWLARAKSPLLEKNRQQGEAESALFQAALSGLSLPAGEGHKEISPIFVVGLPRTGTTLLDRIVSSHSQVESIGESNATTWALRDLLKDKAPRILSPETLLAAAQLDPKALGAAYAGHIGWTQGHATRPVDMMPLNYFFVPLLQRALPNARFVCLRRHPADTVLNNYRQLLENRWGHYDYAYGLSSAADYFVQFDRLTKAYLDGLPRERFRFVEYEALVANLDQTVRDVLDFCDLDFEQACVDFHANPAAVGTPSALQVRAPIHSASVGRWKRYEPYMAEALDILVAGGCMASSERKS